MTIPLAALLCAARAPLAGRSDPGAAADPGIVNGAQVALAEPVVAHPRTDATPARSASRAPGAGFGIQYWGDRYTAHGLAAAPHCALIIEASTRGADTGPDFREELFSADEVTQIRHNGARPVYAYLNVGELAAQRDYWVEAFGRGAPVTGGPVVGGSPPWFAGRGPSDEHLAAYWTPEWEALLRNRIDLFLERSYDGIFLDDVLQYYTWFDDRHAVPPNLAARTGAPRELADFAREMMALVVRLGNYARRDAPHARRDFALLVNGGVYIGWDAASGQGAPAAWHPLFDTYLAAIDAIAIESLLASPDQATTIAELQNTFAQRGVPVLTIDYLSRHPQASAKSFRDQISRQARSLGFRPYIARDERFAELDPPLFSDAPVSATVPAPACARTAPATAGRAKGPH